MADDPVSWKIAYSDSSKLVEKDCTQNIEVKPIKLNSPIKLNAVNAA